MKYTIKISALASADLEEIMAYIASRNPARAESFVDELIGQIKTLANMPERCPVAPEGNAILGQIRHLIHGSYRILFSVEKKQVMILRIIHGTRVHFDVGNA